VRRNRTPRLFVVTLRDIFLSVVFFRDRLDLVFTELTNGSTDGFVLVGQTECHTGTR